jgi:hypothetical protein
VGCFVAAIGWLLLLLLILVVLVVGLVIDDIKNAPTASYELRANRPDLLSS